MLVRIFEIVADPDVGLAPLHAELPLAVQEVVFEVDHERVVASPDVMLPGTATKLVMSAFTEIVLD